MAKAAVLDILDSSLGRYIQDLDTETLNLSLWKGQIDFPRSLKLNVDAINQDFLYRSSFEGPHPTNVTSNMQVVDDWAINVGCDKSNYSYSPPGKKKKDSNRDFFNFNCNNFTGGKTPGSRSILRKLKIVKGSIHKIQIEVPWAALASRPVVVRVSGVNIVLAPVDGRRTSNNLSNKFPQNSKLTSSSSAASFSAIASLSNKDDDSVYSMGIISNLGNSRHGGGSLVSSRHGNTTINSKSSRKTQDTFVGKFFRSLPYSSQMSYEILRSKHKKEEDIIRKKRRFVIQKMDERRIRNKQLMEAMVDSPDEKNDRWQSANNQNIDDVDDFSLSSSVAKKHPSLPKEGSSFYERLKRRILENLQLDISNVHIQFTNDDDDGSNKSNIPTFEFRRYLAGIVLDALSFDTTDEHGRRAYVDRMPSGDEDFLFKALRLSGFGVYLEDRNDMGHETSSFAGTMIDDCMSTGSYSSSSMGGSLNPSLLRHDFIVEPLSFEAAYRQSDNSHSYTEYPKYLLFSQLPHLSMCISRTQIDLMNDIIDSFGLDDPKPLYPEYRPASSITAYTAKYWWKYAFKCIRRIRGRYLWLDFVDAMRTRKQYIALYKRFNHHVICPWLNPLTSEELEEMYSIENDRLYSVEGIVTWRAMAKKLIEDERLKYSEEELRNLALSKKNKFLPFQMMYKEPGLSSMHPQTRMSSQFNTFALSMDEIQELEEQLEYVSDRSVLPKGSKIMEIEFSFGSLVLDLVSTRNSQPLAKLRLGTIETLSSISSGNSSLFRLSVLSIQLEDTMTIQPIFPSILRSVHTKAQSPKTDTEMLINLSNGEREDSYPQAFTLSIETSEEGEKKLDISVVALEFVASSPFLVEIIDFFHFDGSNSTFESSPLGLIWKKSLRWISRTFSNIFSNGSPVLNLGNKQWNINCEIDGPTLVLPDFFCDDNKSDVLVLDFGNYYFSSAKETNTNIQNWLDKIMTKKSISTNSLKEIWKLEVKDVRCFMGTANVCDWSVDTKPEDKVAVKSLVPLLEPIEVSIDVCNLRENESIFHTFHNYNVKSIKVSVSLQILTKAIKVLSSWSSMGKNFFGIYAPDVIRNLNSDRSEIFQSIAELKSGGTLIDLKNSRDPVSSCKTILFDEISIEMEIGLGGYIEAHFLSLKSESNVEVNKSSYNRLSLGQCWLLDKMDSQKPSRLLSHSNLPQMVFLGSNYSYDFIMDKIRDAQEVDGKSKNGSLDITLSFSNSGEDFMSMNPVVSNKEVVELDIAVSNVHLHWHPNALKYFKMIYEKIKSAYSGESMVSKSDFMYYEDGGEDDVSSVESVSTGPDMMGGQTFYHFLIPALFPTIRGIDNLLTYSMPQDAIRVRLVVDMVKVTLNSSVEDKAIFLFSMHNMNIELNQHNNSALESMIKIQSFSITNPTYGQFPSQYEQILTMKKPNKDCDNDHFFLRITFNKVISSIESKELSTSKNFCVAEFGPAEIIFTTKQIFALQNYFIHYIHDILKSRMLQNIGVYFVSFLEPSINEQFFEISSSELTIIIPQCLESAKYIKISVNKALSRYDVFSIPGGGKGEASFHGLTIIDNHEALWTANPIETSLQFSLKETDDQLHEDKSMKVSIQVSPIELKLSKNQCCQIIDTLTFDNDNLDSILGSNANDDFDRFDSFRSVEVDFGNSEFVKKSSFIHEMNNEKLSRMKYIVELRFEHISLHLCGPNEESPESFLNIISENVEIICESIPKSNLIDIGFAIQNFQMKSIESDNAENNNSYLVRQTQCCTIDDSKNSIHLHMKKMKSHFLQISLTVYALDLIFLPDVIKILIDFLNFGHKGIIFQPNSLSISENKSVNVKDCILENHNEENGDAQSKSEESNLMVEENSYHGLYKELSKDTIETKDSYNLDSTFSVKMSKCRLLFYDNGSDSDCKNSFSSYNKTLVLKGEIEMVSKISCSKETGYPTSGSIDCHGEKIEIYSTTSYELEDAIQLLDSSNVSFVGYFAHTDNNCEIQLNFVSLTDLYLSLSTNSALLLLSIISNVRTKLKMLSERLKEIHGQNIEHYICEALPSDGGFQYFYQLVSGQQKKKDYHTNTIKASVTIPKATIVLSDNINNPDQALLKMSTENFLIGGQSTEKMLDFHIHVTNIFEFFNTRSIRWEHWFIEPWVINIKWTRKKNESISNIGKFSTYFDIKSSPIFLSLSDELVKKVESTLTSYTAIRNKDRIMKSGDSECSHDKSILPYGVENRTDLSIQINLEDGKDVGVCNPGESTFFHYESVISNGSGKKFLYGQDVSSPKTINLYKIDDNKTSNKSPDIVIHHMDDVNILRMHEIREGIIIFSEIIYIGSSLVLRLHSQATMYNCTKMAWSLSASNKNGEKELGVLSGSFRHDNASHRNVQNGWLCIPAPFVPSKQQDDQSKLQFYNFKSSTSGRENIPWGVLELPSQEQMRELGDRQNHTQTIPFGGDHIMCHAIIKITFVNECPLIKMFIHPRAVILNNLPVSLLLKATPDDILDVWDNCNDNHESESSSSTYELNPFQKLHVFSAGESISFSIKFSDEPIRECNNDWNVNDFVKIPLGHVDVLNEPIEFKYAFQSDSSTGTCIYLVEESFIMDSNKVHDDSKMTSPRQFCLYPSTCVIDHTNEIVFTGGRTSNLKLCGEMSTNTNEIEKERFTIFEDTTKLLKMREAKDEPKFSALIDISEISVCHGGIEATTLLWDDNSPSGYCAYSRSYVSFNRSEIIHIIPEYLLMNESEQIIRYSYSDMSNEEWIEVENLGSKILKKDSRKLSLKVSFVEQGWITDPIIIEKIEMSVISVKDLSTGKNVGSLAVDIGVGGKDARIIIRIGPPQECKKKENDSYCILNLFQGDFLKVRLYSTQIQILMSELTDSIGTPHQLASLIFAGVDINYHRIFIFENSYGTINEKKAVSQPSIQHFECSKITINAKDISLQDSDPSCSIPAISFERTKGDCIDISIFLKVDETTQSFVIDLININLSPQTGKSSKVLICTNEKFVNILIGFLKKVTMALNFENEMKDKFNIKSGKIFTLPPKSSQAMKFKIVRISSLDMKVSIHGDTDNKDEAIEKLLVKDIQFPIEMEMKFTEFSNKNMIGRIDTVFEIMKIFYKSKLRYNFSQLPSKSSDDTHSISEEKFIMNDLAHVSTLIPGISDKKAFEKIGFHTIHEIESVFNLMQDSDNKAVLKEFGSGAIMYASSSPTDIPLNQKEEIEEQSMEQPMKRLLTRATSVRSFSTTSTLLGSSTRSLGIVPSTITSKGFFSSFSLMKSKESSRDKF